MPSHCVEKLKLQKNDIFSVWQHSANIREICELKNLSLQNFLDDFCETFFNFLCEDVQGKSPINVSRSVAPLFYECLEKTRKYNLFVIDIHLFHVDLKQAIRAVSDKKNISFCDEIFTAMDFSIGKILRVLSKEIASSAIEHSWGNYIKLLEDISGFFKMDPNGIMTKINHEFCKLSGFKRDVLTGACYIPPLSALEKKSYRKFRCDPKIPILTDKKIISIWGTLAHHKAWKGLIKHKTRTGNYFWANVVILPIVDAKNQIREYIVSVSDVTELETGRLELQRSLRRMKELDQKKDDFLNIASHELRTPMTSIKGYISMIVDGDAGEVSDEARTYLKRVLDNTNRLIALINDMLSIAKLESGKEGFSFETYDVREIIQKVVDDFMPVAIQKKQVLEMDITYDTFPLRTDAHKLEQILVNILGNAIKFTPEYGHITVQSHFHNDRLDIHVIDTGIGIKNDEMKVIFEKF